MYYYINKNFGIWVVDSLVSPELIGKDLNDYEHENKFLKLSDEQVQFHKDKPYATALEVWNMKVEHEPVMTVEQAKDMVLLKLYNFNNSDAINLFYVNNKQGWLPADTRSNYRSSIDSAELLGETTIDFILSDMHLMATLQEAKMMLAKIQRYADRCFIVTGIHKNNINELSDVSHILSYNFTVGYPDKEQFDVTNMASVSFNL